MKLGIFTDSHYSSEELTCGVRHNSKSLEKIKEAYDYFKNEHCDLIVCLGDLIDRETSHEKETENLKEIARIINDCSIKTVCVMGNHDAFAFTEDEFYEILQESRPTDIHSDGKCLIFLDTCYFRNGRHYSPGDGDWTDTFLPNADNLKNKLSVCRGDVYIFLHQNLDKNVPGNHRVYNADEINDLLEQYSIVKAVFQGHYHSGKKSIHNGISYITFPAMCENEMAYYIKEI